MRKALVSDLFGDYIQSSAEEVSENNGGHPPIIYARFIPTPVGNTKT